MTFLKMILEVIASAFAPIIKEVLFAAFKDTVEDSKPPADLRESLLDQLRDFDRDIEARRSRAASRRHEG